MSKLIKNQITLTLRTRNLKSLFVLLLSVFFIDNLQSQSLDFETIDANFTNPPNDYRLIHYKSGTTLNNTVLNELEAYGIGGVQTRVWSNQYTLDAAGIENLKGQIELAKARDMQVWIHDERGYPSAAAGGLVVQGHPEYEVRGMIKQSLTGTGTGSFTLNLPSAITFIRATICNVVNGEPDFSTAQEVAISGNSATTSGLAGSWQLSAFGEKILDEDTQAQSTVAQFGQTGHYPSLLNKEACARFIEMTHDKYAAAMQPMGDFVDVFYDGEASLMASYWQYDGSRADYPYIPWEQSLTDAFQAMHGYALMPHLDALFAGSSEEAQTVRLHYYQTIAKLVAENYPGQITEWCNTNGVRSMGHPLLEEDLICHVFNYGDMLSYLREFDVSGCDLHIGRPSNTHWIYWMGKYVSSAAYLDDEDSNTVMGLLDPIIGHGMNDLTPEIPILKRTVNMNMLCGINQFTSYMPYNSATDGYVASEYKAFNEYVGRITMMLRGCQSEAPIGMYYPINTFQSKYVATDKPWNLVANDYRVYQNTIDNLASDILENGIDFNFVTDDVLLNSTIVGGQLQIGNHIYSQLVMPRTEVIPLNVLQKIQTIKAAGIKVHWVDALPQLGTSMDEHAAVKQISNTLLTNNSPISSLRNIRYNEFSVQFETSNYKLQMARFRKENKRIYFVVNDSNSEITLTGTSTDVTSLKIYNPVDGSTKEVSLPLSETIGAYESLLLVETVDHNLGLNDEFWNKNKAIKLYPNPVKSIVNVEVQEQFVGENTGFR